MRWAVPGARPRRSTTGRHPRRRDSQPAIPALFDRIRAQLLSEIIANEREPHAIAELAWRRGIYGVFETAQGSLTSVTPSDLSAFHKAAFARDGLHVAVVGDIDAKALRARLDQLFGDLPQ
ncbi:insulinase family protein, partial [Mesorhizobium sp. M00.F.Ca.ET.220.01.1.1]|uniref:insulinase family protein n=1 Tax=Mesorhizobium sp. M00.F.Ca.ET.220.01.1.1 TaxID=2500531 RepID=UPI001093422E